MFSFQSPLHKYIILHTRCQQQFSFCHKIVILDSTFVTTNYPTRFMPIPEFNYQNNYQRSTSTRHIYTRQPTLFCVCMSGLNYFNSQLAPAFCVCVCRAGLFICILGLWVSVMKLVFVYFILGYRVYRIIITIKIIIPSLPPDTVTTYSCILTTKNIQKNFQKILDFCFVFVYTYASSNETHKTFWR